MTELTLQIPIGDWHEEAVRGETPVKNREDILQHLDKGIHTARIAREYIVWRELGEAEGDTLPANKVLLNAGATFGVSEIARSVKREVEAKDGKTYEAPVYVGKVGRPEKEDEEQTAEIKPSYVRFDHAEALERAESYVLKSVPGHIWNRLLIIHDGGGDVKATAKELKGIIDEMVGRIV